MKTAMQELSDWLNDKDSILSFSGIKMSVQTFIEAEKQQIENAYVNGAADAIVNAKHVSAELYYQTTFKTNQ